VQKRWLISGPTKKTLTNINEHPGIRYRELIRLTGFSNGGISFQLKKLKKSKLVKAKKLGYNMIRYYPITVKTTESNILDHLLNLTRRRIILFVLEHDNCRFNEIKHYIDRSPSTTSFQLQRLEREGIISVLRVNKKNQFYRLKNKSRIIKTVKKYKIAV
jgi:predicted transcriptional regulator